MQRRHLQEIPDSGSNVSTSFTWAWDPSKTSELLVGMGVSVLQDKLANENTPQELLMCVGPPPKRQKVKDKEFVIARRLRLLRELAPGVSWDTLPDELLLGIFSCLSLADLLKVSQVCRRWHRLSIDESLWKTLDLTGKNLLRGVIGQLLPLGVTAFRCPRSCIGNPLFKTSRLLHVQHMDLSNCTIQVADLQSILDRCQSLQNLSLEGLNLSSDIVRWRSIGKSKCERRAADGACAKMFYDGVNYNWKDLGSNAYTVMKITRKIAQNPYLIRLNLSGCSGFSAESLDAMLNSCHRLEELNLAWCDFTIDHVRTVVSHIPSTVTQLNLSGYRQNLLMSDVKSLLERCCNLIHLDLSDSVMLKPECLQYFCQLSYLTHLSLSRCYQIPPAALLELGEIATLKSLQVFGIVTATSLQLLKATLPHIKINSSHFTTVARPTTGYKKNQEIWGIQCRLSLRTTPGF